MMSLLAKALLYIDHSSEQRSFVLLLPSLKNKWIILISKKVHVFRHPVHKHTRRS